MTTGVSYFFTTMLIVTIFVFLWRARNEAFAQIGNGWGIILSGLASLSFGEISRLVLLILVNQERMSAASAEILGDLAYTAIFVGVLVVAIGIYLWLPTVKELTIESATVKKNNNDLRERASNDGMLLSTIPAALYHTSGSLTANTSEIVFVNDKIEELLGYSRADFEADGTLFASLMHVEDKKRFEIERIELWHRNNAVIEHRFRHKNGEFRWLRRYLKRLHNDEEDDVSAEWHGCIFDITDLKRAEVRLANFLEAAPDPVITTNDKGEIVLVNSQAERLYGYSKAQLVGQHIDILIPEEKRELHRENFSEYLKITTSRTIDIGADLNGRHKNGTEFPVEVSVSPIESGNEKLLAFAVRDVSARRNIEAQLRQSQKMEAIGQLTGGIAHDFNNMLTIVIGNLQLLEQISTNNTAISSLTQFAMDASMRAAELVKRLLAFSRKQLLEPRTTKINDLVSRMAPLLRRTVTENVSLKINLVDDLWLARVDRSQLEHALVNLAINARDALKSSGRLIIETKNIVLDETYAAQHGEVTPGEYVMVAVSDNGEGIPADVLPHVFDPFYSTKEIGKGSGLGLSMVYGFVKQSKGHIKIYSEEGYGTTFKIYIPRSKSDLEDAAVNTLQTKAVPVGNETILLVEDDKGVREVAIGLLISLGYKVLQAECGSDALIMLDEHDDIDLMFTDIVMPGGMMGTDLAKRAAAKNKDLKILYATGYTDTAVFDNGLLERNNDVLNKPYRKEQLAHSVREVLDRI